MFRFKFIVLAAALAGLLVSPLGAVPAPPPAAMWKLPTIAPNGSPWHKALTDMVSAWDKSTTGRVKATVYPNGALGGEPAVVRNMRSGQFQASLLMLSGLALIDDGFNALGIPFFFKDDAETRAVQEALTPLLEKRIATKGFHLLAWTNGGWVQLFSKKPLKTLDEVKKANLWTSDGDTRMVQWYKTNGFHPVALDANSVGPSLKIGTIDATPSPPYAALLLNMDRDAPNMLDIHVGPLLGALVVTTTAWNALSAEDQASLTAAAKTFEKTTSADIPKRDTDAVAQMQKRGLTVITLAQKDAADFYAQIDKLSASMRGDMVPGDMYDAAKTARDAYRSKAKGKAPVSAPAGR